MGPQSRSWREILCRIRAQNYCRATLLVPNGRKNRSTSIGYRGFPEVSSIYRFPMSAQNRLPIFLLVGALFSLAYATEEQDETVPREFGGACGGVGFSQAWKYFEEALKLEPNGQYAEFSISSAAYEKKHSDSA